MYLAIRRLTESGTIRDLVRHPTSSFGITSLCNYDNTKTETARPRPKHWENCLKTVLSQDTVLRVDMTNQPCQDGGIVVFLSSSSASDPKYVLATHSCQCPSSVTLGSTSTLTWVWVPTSLQPSGPVLRRCDRSVTVVRVVHWRRMLCWLCSAHWSSRSLTSAVQHWLVCLEHCCRDYSLCWTPPLG